MIIVSLLPAYSVFITEGLVGLVLGFVGWVLVFPLRAGAARIKAEWFRVTAQIDQVQNELTVQRTNCLATLQAQGTSQVKLLEETVEVLREIHSGQLVMTGFLQGSNRKE